jgi:hypothetical protein
VKILLDACTPRPLHGFLPFELSQQVVEIAERKGGNAEGKPACFCQSEQPAGMFGERLAVG